MPPCLMSSYSHVVKWLSCTATCLIALAHCVVEVVSRVGKFNSSAHMMFEGLLVSEWTLKHLPNHCLQQRRCLDDFHQTLCRRGKNNIVYESEACYFISIHFFRISNINWKDCKYEILHFSGTIFVLAKFVGSQTEFEHQHWPFTLNTIVLV